MSTAMLLLCGVNLLLTMGLIWGLLQLNKQTKALAERIGAREPQPPSAPPLSGSRIEVEILNPFALAARETALAKPAAALAPELIRRIVYDRAAGDIAKELVGRGVEARVSVRRA